MVHVWLNFLRFFLEVLAGRIEVLLLGAAGAGSARSRRLGNTCGCTIVNLG